MMSRCFTRFPIGGLGETYIYQNFGDFTRMWGFYLKGVWLWRISGGYSQEMMELVLGIITYLIRVNNFPSQSHLNLYPFLK